MSKKITDNQFIYYFQENCTENLALQIDYSIKEIGFISIFKSAYIKHKGKVPTDKLLKFCPIFDIKDAVEFHAFICKFCEIKRGFFIQERFDKVINEITEKSNKSKASITARWNKSKTLKGDTNEHTNVSTNDYTKDKVKVKVKDKDIIINNNIEKIDKKEIEIPDFIDAELWNGFLEMRIETKAKPTDLAIKGIVNKLIKFEESERGNANIALENSIENNWKGVFEPKINNNSTKKYGCDF